MSTNMKTIKFGEDGKVYDVNAWAVERSGELSEAATVIDFGGAFDEGLTEINAVVRGVEGATGDYFFIGINGIETNFISYNLFYTDGITIKIKKVGNLWDANIYGSGNVGNAIAYVKTLLENVDTITQISVKAYNENGLPVGMKYALEGR